ncbi:MAG: hypothetical protein DRK00_11590 [Thermoprotei archaeon]|nr:MAG: hypothetical protein DRK00_11590 [Thermoprotei archaeon]
MSGPSLSRRLGGPEPIEVIVAEILARVEVSRLSLRSVMEDYFKQRPRLKQARGLARAYATGVLRTYRIVDELADRVLGLDPEFLPPFERNLLRALLYEARFRDVRDERILAIGARYGFEEMDRAALRRVRELDVKELVRGLSPVARMAVEYSQPDWVVEYLVKLLGSRDARRLLKAFNREPTTWIRVNTARISVERLESRLRRRGIIVERDEHLPFMLRVVRSEVNISRIPEYGRGLFYIQDKGSALAAHLLGGESQVVVDVTAAPGGKASLLHQLWSSEVVALEIKRKRAMIMRKLLGRLGAWKVYTVVADSRVAPLRGRFSKVIVDPDCSSLGRLGHSPEMRLWIKPSVIRKYAFEQRALLKVAYDLLERGGELVYSTCTLTLEENEENIAWALESLGMELLEARPRVGLPGLLGLRETQRLYPHLHGTTGFFIAKLRKE